MALATGTAESKWAYLYWTQTRSTARRLSDTHTSQFLFHKKVHESFFRITSLDGPCNRHSRKQMSIFILDTNKISSKKIVTDIHIYMIFSVKQKGAGILLQNNDHGWPWQEAQLEANEYVYIGNKQDQLQKDNH